MLSEPKYIQEEESVFKRETRTFPNKLNAQTINSAIPAVVWHG